MYPRVHVVRGSGGGVLYWNANKALLFIQVSISGTRMNYLRYALEPLLVGMGHVRPPDNARCSQTFVIRVTQNDIQHYDADLYRYAEEPYCGYHFALFDGHIYAGYLAEDKLWKWSGTEFELASVEELRAFHGAMANDSAASRNLQFDNVDGWSMRTLGQTAPMYQLVLSGQPLTMVFHGETWPPAPLSVDLMRPGQPPQTIWSFDGRPHRVSKAEYDRSFGSR